MKRIAICLAFVLLAVGSLFAASLPAKGPVRPHALDVANPFLDNRVHRGGAVCLNITNHGIFGNEGAGQANPMNDPCNGDWAPQGEYPCGSGQEYLYMGALWLGAMVNDSGFPYRRVSVGYDGWIDVSELFPGEGAANGIHERSNEPGRVNCLGENVYDPAARANQEFVAQYSDTLDDPFWINEDPIDGPHRPLGLQVTQSSMTWSSPEFDDFVVFEFRLRNIGAEFLQNVYLGLYVDGDVGMWNEMEHHTDDITGFLAVDTLTGDTFNIAYIADNDGRPSYDPTGPLLYPHVSGMYVLQAPQQNLKWSYNWWVSNGDQSLDYGPCWEIGVPGTPMGDDAKYEIMSNGELDFDQIKLDEFNSVPAQVYHDPCNGADTTEPWRAPDTPDVFNIANGYDTRYLISCGPLGIFDHIDPNGDCIYRLNPGEETTLTVAYVFGSFFHNPDNPQTDPEQIDPSKFDFTSLLHNARRAQFMFANNYAYQPPVAPPNFRPSGTLDGAVPLAWSVPQVGTAQGYFIYGFDITDPGNPIQFNTTPTQDTVFTAGGLTNGSEWILYIQTIDDSGITSGITDTLVRVGAPLPVTGLTATLDSSVVNLSWNPSSDPGLAQYLVLRRSDHLDSASFVTTSPAYTDLETHIGYVYTYWVIAQNANGLISYLSAPVTVIPWDPDRRILVIDDTDNIHTLADSLRGGVNGDSVNAFYLELMNASGEDFEVLHQPDNQPLGFDLETLAHYDVVVWYAEDNRTLQWPDPQYVPSREQIFRQYVESGGKLLRASRKFLNDKLGIAPGHIGGTQYMLQELLNPLSFDSVYSSPGYTSAYSGMRFVGAQAIDLGFPDVQIDTAKVHALQWASQHLNYLPEIDAFWSNDATYWLYRSVVTPEDTSGLGNQPCAVIGHNEIVLAFPLYFLRQADAQALLNASINALRTYNFDVPRMPRSPLPVSSVLEQNYPNPFNPATTLRFSLAKAGNVKLAIYNLLGQQVRVLVDQPLTEGMHRYVWDAQAMASGIYLARLEAPDGVRVVKLALIR